MENSHFIHRVHNAGNYVLFPDYEGSDVEAIDITVKVAYPVDRKTNDYSTIHQGRLIKSGANSYIANIIVAEYPVFYTGDYIHVLFSDEPIFDFSEYEAVVVEADTLPNAEGAHTTDDHRQLEDGIAFRIGNLVKVTGPLIPLSTIGVQTNDGKTITITFTETEKYAKFNDVIFDNIDLIETIPYGELSQGNDIIIRGWLLEPNTQYGLSIWPYDEEGDVQNITVTSNADGNIETTYSGGDKQWSQIDLTDSEFQELICSYTLYYDVK